MCSGISKPAAQTEHASNIGLNKPINIASFRLALSIFVMSMRFQVNFPRLTSQLIKPSNSSNGNKRGENNGLI